MNNETEKAVSRFNEGFNCAQALLSAFASRFGLSEEEALRLATPFGGGIARMGEVCGAVSGALMALGLRHGYSRQEDKEAKEACYGTASVFAARFRARHGSIVCRELLGCDLTSTEGTAHFKEKNLLTTVCAVVVRDAAEIVSELLGKG
jgi:C_GCAxxG_C_C family probable redox protein